MFSQIIPILLLSATAATPLQARNAQASSSSVSATMISYFVNDTCDSPYSRSYRTIASDVCMNLGEGSTTRSVELQDLNAATGSGCMIQVYNDGACTDVGTNKVMQVKIKDTGSVCVGDEATQILGRLGSMMMVC